MNKQFTTTLLPFMDLLTGLVGVMILMNIILALEIPERDKVEVRVVLQEPDSPKRETELEPIYVVCAADNIKIGETSVAIPKTHEEVKELEGLIKSEADKKGKSAYILALIRPDGYESFGKLRKVVDGLGLRLGYEPVGKDWTIVGP